MYMYIYMYMNIYIYIYIYYMYTVYRQDFRFVSRYKKNVSEN